MDEPIGFLLNLFNLTVSNFFPYKLQLLTAELHLSRTLSFKKKKKISLSIKKDLKKNIYVLHVQLKI